LAERRAAAATRDAAQARISFTAAARAAALRRGYQEGSGGPRGGAAGSDRSAGNSSPVTSGAKRDVMYGSAMTNAAVTTGTTLTVLLENGSFVQQQVLSEPPGHERDTAWAVPSTL